MSVARVYLFKSAVKNRLSLCRRQFSVVNIKNDFIDISSEVKLGLRTGKPIVALESTIMTHGMPYPTNLNCALEVENIVRDQGAIPATIAIINGRIKVGLKNEEITYLAKSANKAIKTSRRDIAYVVANKLNGGTTVAGTLVIAEKIGIPIFATGGLGGVHRCGESTLDISADLTEMGRSSVAVISSGVKSILDIPRTLEYLETEGVTVVRLAENNEFEFPAFYTRNSGCNAPYSVKWPSEAAKLIYASQKLKLNSGLLLANPIPEEHALNADVIEKAINDALLQAERNHIKGKEITPYLLTRVAKITAGQSLESNIALIKNNAKVGAQIAVELSNLHSDDAEGCTNTEIDNKGLKTAPVVIGGSVVDNYARLQKDEVLKMDGSTHKVSFALSGGGVGRNICDALHKLGGCTAAFVSAVGIDLHGDFICSLLPSTATVAIERSEKHATAQYTGLVDAGGEMQLGLGDMDIHHMITPDVIKKYAGIISKSPLLILDGNLSTEAISYALELADKHGVPVFYEPTDIRKAAKPFNTQFRSAVSFISPNLAELEIIRKNLSLPVPKNCSDKISSALAQAKLISPYVDTIIVTLGSLGVLIVTKNGPCDSFFTENNGKMIKNQISANILQARLYPAKTIDNIISVSGAGDCFTSGFILGMLKGFPETKCISIGFAAAEKSLLTRTAIPKQLFKVKEWVTNADYKILE